MNKKCLQNIALLIANMIFLTACNMDNTLMPTHEQSYMIDNTMMDSSQKNEELIYAQYPEKKEIVVPDTYLIGSTHSPTTHQKVDKAWVSQQNGESYTIDIGSSEKPAQVAGMLAKTPKTERTAEIKYQREGKTFYKGLYGSYSSYEAAQQALNSLPEEIKNKAGIQKWDHIQKNIAEE